MDRREFVAVTTGAVLGIDLAVGKDRTAAVGFHGEHMIFLVEETPPPEDWIGDGGFAVPPEYAREIGRRLGKTQTARAALERAVKDGSPWL